MTRWVNRALEEALSKIIEPENSPSIGLGPISKTRQGQKRDQE